jgi:uncharacterized membrane protein required for colicin V production
MFPEPYESVLWSVLDVFRFFPSPLITCIIWYDIANIELANGKVNRQEFLIQVRENLEGIAESAKASGMNHISDQAESIVSRWLQGDSADDAKIISIKTLVSQLIGAIQTELKDELFFRIDKRHRPFYDKLLLTPEAESAFPSSIRDMVEAGRCYALDRSTACVLHLMRALEIPINALVKALNFTPSSPNWEQVLNESEREIRKISPATNGPTWKEDEQFYSEAALHFRFIKNAWRNYAVHRRDTYNDHEAWEIMTHVRSFTDHLAKKLAEPKGKP